MTTYSLRLLIVGAIFLSNYVTWTASRHHFRHNASGHRSRHRRQGSGLYLSSSYVIPGGEGDGWGEWGVVSPCSRSCGGGVASQKRICLQIGPDGKKQCTGGDTKYYSCQTQDCPEGSPDFRAQQCSEFDNQDFRGYMYKWVPYTKAPNPCELNCMPHGEHFYYRHKATVVDGTRCNDDSFDVCVDGTCQPVGCDMMLGSNAREDKCRVCRGNGSSCHTITGLFNSQDLVKGYNDILLIPEGSTSIVIEEIQPSNNYLALRGKNGTYYLNGHYNIDFPRVMIIAGAPWKYERSPLGFPAPDRLRCAGPTNEPIYLSLLLQDENVGIEYEYSVPNTTALPKHEHYNWVHDEFTPCSVACGGGFQTRNVTCRSMDELETVDDVLCDEGLKPVTNQTCNTQACPAQWVEGPWGPCSQRCGKGGVTSRNVTCEKIIANGYSSVVPESECFASLGPKPELFQTCNEDAPCPQWYTGPWKPCNKLCGDGEQTRQVVCYQKKDGRIHVLDDKECTEEKPEHTKPCLLQYCEGVDWVATQWIGCESCLSENRTRHVQCVTKIGTVINDTYCSYHNKPKEQEPCNKNDLPLCAYMWYSSQWSKCSVECGEGVQTRKVFCGLYDGLNVVPAENSKCDKETKYKDSKPCTVPKEKCPAQWYAGPWSKCSKECGTGERSRQTMCLEGQKLSMACKLETVIDSSGICNSKKCIPTTTPVYCEDEEEEYAEVGADLDDEDDSSMEISEEGSGDPLLSITSSFSKYEGNTSSTTTASDDNETSSTITGSEISPTDADIVLTDDGSGFEPLTTNLSTSETNELDIGTTSSDKRTTLFLMSVEPEDVIIDTKTTTVISSKSDNDNSTVTQTPATDVNATYSTTISSNAITTITQSPSIGFNDTDSKTILSNETELYTSTVTQSPDTDVNVTDSTTILLSEAENDTSTITQSPGIDVNTTDSTTSSERENDTSTVTQAPNIDGNDTDSTTISLSATRNDTSEITPSTSIDANATYTMTISSSETENSTFTVTESPGTDTNVTELTTIPSNEAENDTSTITQSPSIGINDTDSTTILSNETELYSSTVTQSPGTDINATDLTSIFSSATENDTSAITESLSSDVNATDSTTSSERENDTSTVTEPPNIDMNATYSTTISSNATTTITQSPSIGVNDTDSTTILPNETELYTSTVTQSPDTDINVTDSTTILSSEAGNDTTITQSPGIDVNTTDSTTSSEGENETSTVTQAPNIDVNDTDSTTISLSATGSTRSEITPSTSIDANATYTMTISSSETENRTFTVTESPGIDINATDLTTISSSATENYTSTITESPSTNINATDSTTISSTETENEISTITESSVTWTNDTESSTISSSETENDTSVITQTPSLNVNATDLTTEGQSIVSESSTTVEITSITTVTTEISENETSVSENETRFTTPTGSTEVTTTSTEETEANITTIENTESTTLSSESTYVESSTTETSTDVITSTMEGFLTTTESTTEVTSTDVSSSAGVLFSTQYPMCVPRPRRKCAITEFGCCPDRKTPAKGPFDLGCNKEETCEQTKYKCCPDGVTPAQGENGAGCVTTPCGETLFGCCLSDNKTAAEGNDQEGCPKPCVSSQFGCCEDNMTEALGPNKQGCPESADIKSTTTETTESIETTSVTESTIISETSTEISSETSNVSEPVTETSTETRNVSEPVTETSGESSSVSEIGTEITSESSTVEETSTVTAELTTVVEGCAATEFGCCSDNETPAHGPDFEGCCLLTSFGCCKDNRKAAKGPHLEGCECQYTHYGCCPDNVTTSLGPDNKGCGCQYTQHGCCPDRHTEATGPEYEGCPCSTYQFGCCPDGVRVAEGPGQQGCHCRYSKYGCCSDDETPASSQDPSGCSCAATKYGCCLDGTTAAQGPKFLGCADKPENKQAVCTLPTDSGPCHEYSAYWFYDVAYGGCSRFWYGGCEGNGNRFATKEDCEDVCVQPPSKDVCKLPAVKGPCEGDSVRWYYNGTREQCTPFTYGGCLGNANNFDSRDLCQAQCEPEKSTDQCSMSIEQGSCAGNYTRWGFNKEMGKCEQFVWSGCEGNANKFTTEAACLLRCKPPGTLQLECTEPQESGNCTEKEALWSFSQSENRCIPFYYTGCGGNHNRFESRASCEQTCPSAYAPDKCTLIADVGSCSNYRERWFYDTRIKRCRQFYYGGCGGNENNFGSEAECESSCSETVTTVAPTQTTPITAPQPQGAPPAPTFDLHREEFCFLEIDPGQCDNYVERWAYDSRTGKCTTFQYGGCGGNTNNFQYEEYCTYYCHPVQDICQLPMVSGPCNDSIMSWFYNAATDSCSQFTYGGCNGNDNRFGSREACESRCKTGTTITSTTVASTTAAFTFSTSTVRAAGSRSEDLPAECRIPVTETCVSAGTVWYYDEARYECVAHQNLDSGDQCRHTGVYPSEEACLRKCGAFRDVDACAQSVDPGPCRSFQIKVYFDQAAGECRQYYYGGCLGGANRFSTIEECEHLCKPERLLTLSPTTTTQAPPVQVREECITPSSLEPCGGNSTAYYYDSERKVCVESDIGGCQHPNGYRTEEECERTCGRFREINVCAARLDPGVCRASIPKYYWDATTSKCELYAYGGCGGGPNRFSTSDECEEVCGASGPATACLQEVDTGRTCDSPAVSRWHYSPAYLDCLVFAYQGCDGNENNFESYEECAEICKIPNPQPEPQPCKVYEDTCKELRCAHGVQHSYTREGCTTCTCAEPTADCEPARQECEALICQFGLQRETGPDGCERCTCSDDPCVTASCAPTERCVAAPHTDPTTQETRYSAQCIPDTRTHAPPPDCRAYSGACAALRCEYGVQRTRLPNGCERCACVRPQVDCTPLTSECEQLKCNYNVITTLGDDGCKRCKCSGNPCENEICGDDERCAIVEYKSPVSLENRFYTECRKVNKDGLCPTEEIDSTDECRSECYDDSYCRGPAKCCRQGCSRVCLAAVPATSAAPTPLTTTHAPDIKQPPKFDPRQKTNVTVSVGGKATLRCVFHSNPPPKITWRRGELTIDGDVGRYRLLSDGALEIVSLVRDDSGVYICVADNGLGVAKQKIHLVVSDPVPIPVGIAGDENAVITGELGQPLSIRCHAYGYPPPGVTWYRGQSTVPFDNAVYLARNNILLIRQLSVETLGDYTCHAYSGSGPAASWAVSVKAYRPEGISIEHEYLVPHKTIAEITRIEKPRSTTPRVIRTTTTTTEVPVMRIFNIPVDAHIRPVSGPLSANGELRLTCELGGYPDPEVYWSRDGNRLAPDDRTIISGSGGSESRLIISRLSTSDSGLYACNAYNDYSSDIDTAHITVNQAVSIPLNCTDNPFFANCTLIVLNNYCQHKYYSRFCCKSCVEAGLLNPQDAEFQADQPFRRK